MGIKKIGILTWHYYGNVGSNLQAIAMQTIFSTQNTTTEFINYRPNYKVSWYGNIIRHICSSISEVFPYLLPEMFRFRAYEFQKQFMKQSELISDKEELVDLVHKYDAVICGSDQIWAPNVFKREYLLSFVPDEINKYSYAASVGLDRIPSSLVDNYKQYLKRFRLIGIREVQGVQLISTLIPECSSRIVDVLDPTLLVSVSFWDNIMISPRIKCNYLFCYFLGQSKWHRDYATKIAVDNGLKLVIYSNFQFDKSYADKHIKFMGPREFIGYISEATYVMTDSFHGTLFSIIYQKQFNIFYRFEDNDPICQNSRILNLISKFHLESSVILNSSYNISRINYNDVNKKVEYEVLRSKQFINDILNDIGGDDA